MGKTNQGILGAFTGSIGTVTGYVRNGQNIMRTRVSNVKYKRTPLRIAQLEKIKICNRFTRAFTGRGFFEKTFPAYGSTGSGYNRATSALLSQALVGDYPDMQLSYPKVMISKGRLPPAENATANAIDGGNIEFTFTDNSGTGIAAASDVLILAVYVPALQQAMCTLQGGLRKDGTAVLNARFFAGYAVETWIGFLSSDGRDASDSCYTGQVML